MNGGESSCTVHCYLSIAMVSGVVFAIFVCFTGAQKAIATDSSDQVATGHGASVSLVNGANASGNIQSVDLMRVFQNTISLSFANKSDSITLICQNPQMLPRPSYRSICEITTTDAAFWIAALIIYITTVAILISLCARSTLRNHTHSSSRDTRDCVDFSQPNSIDLTIRRSDSRVVVDS